MDLLTIETEGNEVLVRIKEPLVAPFKKFLAKDPELQRRLLEAVTWFIEDMGRLVHEARRRH